MHKDIVTTIHPAFEDPIYYNLRVYFKNHARRRELMNKLCTQIDFPQLCSQGITMTNIAMQAFNKLLFEVSDETITSWSLTHPVGEIHPH